MSCVRTIRRDGRVIYGRRLWRIRSRLIPSDRRVRVASDGNGGLVARTSLGPRALEFDRCLDTRGLIFVELAWPSIYPRLCVV